MPRGIVSNPRINKCGHKFQWL